MPQKSSTKSAKRAGQLKIRAYEDGDRDALVALWETCDLAKPWNDPEPDIKLFQDTDSAEIFVGEQKGTLIGSV